MSFSRPQSSPSPQWQCLINSDSYWLTTRLLRRGDEERLATSKDFVCCLLVQGITRLRYTAVTQEFSLMPTFDFYSTFRRRGTNEYFGPQDWGRIDEFLQLFEELSITRSLARQSDRVSLVTCWNQKGIWRCFRAFLQLAKTSHNLITYEQPSQNGDFPRVTGHNLEGFLGKDFRSWNSLWGFWPGPTHALTNKAV
jgi:hypothetical protein